MIIDASFGTKAMTADFFFLFGEEDGGIHLLCFCFKNRSGLFEHFTDDHGRLGLDDASLLASNLSQSVTQKSYMVETDVGDDAHFGCDDVRAIQPAAQTHFQQAGSLRSME